VSGHATTPPKSVMNSRRLMPSMGFLRGRPESFPVEGTEVLATNPIADLDGKWAGQGITSNPNFLRNVYNGFRNRD
jgi:hypothetical protein